jgi:hypothetical protein
LVQAVTETAVEADVEVVDEAADCSMLDVYCCSAFTSPERNEMPALEPSPLPDASLELLELDVELVLEVDEALEASGGGPPPW